jgi:two-component system LytT family response regulator
MKPLIRVVLVDDEPPARERLATLLADHPHVRIIGEAGNVPEAARLCAELRPDLIFLDIQMPRASGFELLPLLTTNPSIIFVTAFDRFAVRAFEVNALDYLLKPVHPDRLVVALERVEGVMAGAGQDPSSEVASLLETDMVRLQEDRKFRVLPLPMISWIEAEGNFTRVYLADGPPAFVRRSLTVWDQILPPALFARIERSMIVRLGAVKNFRYDSREKAVVELEGRPHPLELRRRAALRLRQALDGVADGLMG